MPAYPLARAGGSRPPSPIPRLPGGRWTAWVVILGGWTLFGLSTFCSEALADARSGAASLSPVRLLALSLGGAWIWAALTPVALGLTPGATFTSGRWLKSAGIHAVVGAGFIGLSTTLQWFLAVALDNGDPGPRFLHERFEFSLLAYLVLMALGQAAHYFGLYRTRHLHASELETRLARTHLQVLKMQLQPHFLFNTLNTVAELVHTEPDAADQMITRLGRLLRLSLDHAGHQVVPLRQEIDFLRMYVEIEQVRFQDRLQIIWDLGPDTLDAAVPTLIWQPVLENAIRHGVTPLAGRGRIVIASRRQEEDLILEIRDNGKGLPSGGVAREGVGLRNIRERVEQLYGSQARFVLEPALGGGTIATLRLPFTQCEGAHTPVPLTRGDPERLIR